MRKLFIVLSLALLPLAATAQTKVQRGVVRMITHSATDPIVPVQGVQVVVAGVANKASDKSGRFSLNVNVNSDGSYSLTDVRIPKGRNLVWASPQKKKRLFLSKEELDVAVATQEEKDAEYKKRYENLQTQYRKKVKELKAARDKYDDALIDLQQSDARYAQVEAERDSVQKIFSDYITNKEKIDQWMESVAEELSLVDYQSLNSLERHIYELKCAGEWKTINDLVSQFMGGDAKQTFNKIKEKEQAAAAKTAQKQQELASAMQEEQDVAKERESWFRMMEANIESFRAQYLNDSVSYYYEMLIEADTTNYKYLNEAGMFEHTYRGKYDKAMHYFMRALDYADEDTDKDVIYSNLGVIYGRCGKYDVALEYHSKSLEIKKNLYGENHPQVATSYNNISEIYASQGNYTLALEYNEKALNIRKSTLGENHIDIASSYNNIGCIYEKQGEYAKSLEYHKKALEIKIASYGEMHPDVAMSYNNIGLVYDSQGDYDKALEYYEKSLNIRKTVLDEDHIDLFVSYNNIGTAYGRKGNNTKALEYFDKAQNVLKNIFGENHIYVATMYNNIGSVYSSQGDYDKALEYYFKSLDIRKKIYGENSYAVAMCYNNIGLVYNRKKNTDKALECYNKVLEIVKADKKEYRNLKISTYGYIAFVYSSKNDYFMAVEYLEKAIVIMKELYGDKHAKVIDLQRRINLGKYKIAMADKKTAKEYLKCHSIVCDVVPKSIASERGLSGTYTLLAFGSWTIDNETIDFFAESEALYDKAKTIVFYRDGEIREEQFENKVGIQYNVIQIDESEKSKTLEAYRKWKSKK